MQCDAASLLVLVESLGLAEQIKNFNQRGSNDDKDKESNQPLRDVSLVFVLLLDWNIASFRDVLVKLFCAIANTAWKRLNMVDEKIRSEVFSMSTSSVRHQHDDQDDPTGEP